MTPPRLIPLNYKFIMTFYHLLICCCEAFKVKGHAEGVLLSTELDYYQIAFLLDYNTLLLPFRDCDVNCNSRKCIKQFSPVVAVAIAHCSSTWSSLEVEGMEQETMTPR